MLNIEIQIESAAFLEYVFVSIFGLHKHILSKPLYY